MAHPAGTGLAMGRREPVWFDIPATPFAAGTNQFVVAPMDGWVTGLYVVIQTALSDHTTNITLDVVVDGDDNVPVNGLTLATPAEGAAGTTLHALPTPDHESRRVKKGQAIEIKFGSEHNAGAIRGFIEVATAGGATQ